MSFPAPSSSASRPGIRRVAPLVAQFDAVAASSRRLIRRPLGEFQSQGRTYALPRYVWNGPEGGGDTLRLGLFATLSGTEPEGALALAQLIASLEQNPELGQSYALFVYPVCNPTGFEDASPRTRAGHDLVHSFWTGSYAPEIRSLESEIWMRAFHGIVHLRSDLGSSGVYGSASGAVFSDHLLEPALNAAEAVLPRNRDHEINGRPSRRGIIYSNENGLLRAVPGLERPPFELTLAAPRSAPVQQQVESLVRALQTVLIEFRHFIAIAQNI